MHTEFIVGLIFSVLLAILGAGLAMIGNPTLGYWLVGIGMLGITICAGWLGIIYPKRRRNVGIAIAAKLEEGQGSYGLSVDGQLSTATVFVEVTAKNRGASDVRISGLRCELYRRWFGFWTQLVQTLPYFDFGTDQLDWLLVANGIDDKPRSVIFSRHSDYPWSVVKVQPGETLGTRMVAVFSSGLSPSVIELPEIAIKGPYA